MDVDNEDTKQMTASETNGVAGKSLLSLLRETRKNSHKIAPRCRRRSSDKFLEDIASPTKAEYRIAKDMEEIKDAKWCARRTSVTIVFPTKRLSYFSVTIVPVEGFYRNGEFHFDIRVPDQYPFVAPKIICRDKVCHPNFDSQSGEVGLSIVQCDWKATLSMNDVLFSLQLLFCEPNVPQNYSTNPNNNNNNNNNNKNNNNNNSHNNNSKICENKDCNDGNEEDFDMSFENSSDNSDEKDDSSNIVLNSEACDLYLNDRQLFEKIVQDIIHGKYDQDTNCKQFGQHWPKLLKKREKTNQRLKNRNHNHSSNSIRSQSLTPHHSHNNNGYYYCFNNSNARSLTPQTSQMCQLSQMSRSQSGESWKQWNNNDSNTFCDNNNNNINNNDQSKTRGHTLYKTPSVCGKRKYGEIDNGYDNDALDMNTVKHEISQIDKNNQKFDKRIKNGKGSLLFVYPDGEESENFWQKNDLPPSKKARIENEKDIKRPFDSNNSWKIDHSQASFSAFSDAFTNAFTNGFGGFSGFGPFGDSSNQFNGFGNLNNNNGNHSSNGNNGNNGNNASNNKISNKNVKNKSNDISMS